jgi:hypothetical protein
MLRAFVLLCERLLISLRVLPFEITSLPACRQMHGRHQREPP